MVMIDKHLNGKTKIIYKYNSNDQLHCTDGPAVVHYGLDGKTILEEDYYINGNRHNESGPALIKYYIKNNIFRKQYFINGKMHREDGPAFIEYDKSGKITKEFYFYNNIQLSINKIDFEYKQFLLKIRHAKKIQRFFANKILINMSKCLNDDQRKELHDLNDSRILLEMI